MARARRNGGEPTPGTTYIVLSERQGFWKPESLIEAHSSDQAVRKFAATLTMEEPVRLVAVSKRSWQPKLVEAKVRTSLRISDAGN